MSRQFQHSRVSTAVGIPIACNSGSPLEGPQTLFGMTGWGEDRLGQGESGRPERYQSLKHG